MHNNVRVDLVDWIREPLGLRGVFERVADGIADDCGLVSLGIFERVADGIADHRGLMGFGAFAAVGAGFNVLLGVVPGAAAVVEDSGKEDAGDGADHQHRGYGLRADTQSGGR